MFASIICPDCEYIWMTSCDTIIEDGIEISRVGLFDDICPICGTQGDVDDLCENEFAALI